MNIGKRSLTEKSFFELWKHIERELEEIYNNRLCCASLVYNNIYIICTSISSGYDEKLYWKIGDFMYIKARELRNNIYIEDDWVEAYNINFYKFKRLVFCINDLCEFFNDCIKGRSIKDFGFMLWERCVLQQSVRYKQTSLGYELINRAKIEQVKDAIESMRLIVPDPKYPLLYYTQRYEQPALEKIKTKYKSEIEELNCGILDYSVYVKEKIELEKKNRESIFLSESWENLEEALEEIFILNLKNFIYSGIYKCLNEHKLPLNVLSLEEPMHDINNFGTNKVYETPTNNEIKIVESTKNNDFYTINKNNTKSKEQGFPVTSHNINPSRNMTIHFITTASKTFKETNNNLNGNKYIESSTLKNVRLLYQNLGTLKSGYEIIKAVFVEYLNQECSKNIEIYSKNIESLYVFYCLLKNVIDVGFMGDPEYIKIFKAKLANIYSKLKPSFENRLIEYANAIVRNDEINFRILKNLNAENQFPELKEELKPFSGDEKKESLLLRIFLVLFKLVENKTEFYEIYLESLSKRLLLRESDIQKEKKIINLIKKRGTVDFIRKAEAMINDLTISLSFNKDLTRSVWMLTQAYWPLEPENNEIKIPEALNLVKKAYDFKFNKKKIYWMWNLSKVTIEINNQEIETNIFQYTIINLFNFHEKINKEIVLKETNMNSDFINFALKSLIQSGVVNLIDNYYVLNKNLNNSNICKFFHTEIIENERVIDKAVYYQSLIAKVLKKGKKMNVNNILEAVVSAHTTKFLFVESSYNEAIKSLVDKGIADNVGDLYYYAP